MSDRPTETAAASVDAINAALATIPMGATLRAELPPATDIALAAAPWRGFIPPEGVYACARRCGTTTRLPGICDACVAAQDEEDADEAFRAATESIPDGFRWAAKNAPDLGPACGIIKAGAGNIAERIDKLSQTLLTGENRVILIRGRADTGKTVLACALMRAVVDAGRASWLAYRRTNNVDRTRALHAEPRLITIARAARFVPARDIMIPRVVDSDQRSAYDIAKGVPLLVLDDLGQELQTKEDSAAIADRIQAAKDIIAERWDRARATIITTYLADKRIGAVYGGGIQKRICWASHVRVVELGGGHGKGQENKGDSGT